MVSRLLSLLVQEWALPLANGVDDWNPSHWWYARERLLLCRRSLAGRIPARIGKWSGGVGSSDNAHGVIKNINFRAIYRGYQKHTKNCQL